MNKRKAYLKVHQGLGDHIVCIGLYKTLAMRFDKCVLPVQKKYFRCVSEMLSDVHNILVTTYEPRSTKMNFESWYFFLEAQEKIFNRIGYISINIGSFDTNFLTSNTIRFDAEFYRQADVPFENRWKFGKVCRNSKKEEELFNKLVTNSEPYIFLHQDKLRGYSLNPKYFPKGMKIVEPLPSLSKKFTATNYLKVIENSSAIHCIESSFCALIETFQLEIPKFAHRYARPEAKLSKQLQFTYRSNWQIINF